MDPYDVTISTFVNPHLFWIIESRNEEETKSLQHLMSEANIKQPDLDTSFEIGEIVAIRYGKRYYRAIIEDLRSGMNTDTLYMCWLMDYGTMLETPTVYKLPAPIRRIKPTAMQASLNNVVYVQQHLTYDEESGEPKTFVESITTPTSIAHQVSLELMLYAKKLKFVVENKAEGILLGDVLYEKNNEEKSLRRGLIDKGVLIVNEILFHEIQENIYNYKETHLSLIIQICKKLNSNLILEENQNKSDCQNIISKYLAEFDNRDLFDDDEVLQPFKVRRGRRRHGTDSSNTLNSENDSISDGDISKKLKDLETSDNSLTASDKKTRAKMLLEKLKRLQRKSLEMASDKDNMLTDDDGHRDNENKENHVDNKTSPSVNAKRKLMEYVKAKKLELSARKDTDDSSNSVENQIIDAAMDQEPPIETPPIERKKRVIPKNVIFQPGGAAFTIVNKMVTSTPKTDKVAENDEQLNDTPKASSDDNSTTEETKSDCPLNDPTSRVCQLKIKPHCSCKQCEHWTHDSDWQKQLQFGEESKGAPRSPLEKPQKLFREDEGDRDRSVISLDFSSVTKVQKQAMLKLVVHGEYSPTPTKSVAQASFHKDIHGNLRHLEYRETKRIQAYSWPGMLRYQHVCMVNGPQSGKTMGYLPIMLTFLLEKTERYEPLPKSSGPIFIILCTSSKKCEDVYDLAKLLLGRNRARISLITYPITHVNASHIDFLVTTPPVLIDLIKSNAITFKRLCHLILEDADKILARDTEIMKIFSLTQNMLQHRSCLKPVQLIICAEHWTSRMEVLLKKLDKTPLVCIGNYMEAALYSKVQFSMRFVNSACKEHELKNLLKDTHKIYKSVIVCKKEEIDEIQTILMLKGIDATIISEDMSKETILYLEEVWTNCKGGQYTVLVCTDFLLNTLLTITSASLLIHYSLPISWTKFVKRFSCLLENCNSPLDSKESKIKCQTVIICDEECEGHMSKFFSFIDATELRHQLPEKFKKYSQDLKRLDEEKKLKTEVSLCDTLKLFGTCTQLQCPRRHIIDKNLDVSPHMPQSGSIKFKIVHIQDVTRYSIELLQHIDLDGKVHECDDILDVTEDFTNTLRISKKRIISPVVGHLYAFYDIEELDGVYRRCELLEIDNESVKIKLIDKGVIVGTVKSRLYRLPKEFKDAYMPRKIYDAILASLAPPYGDETFSARSFFHLKNLLDRADYKNIVLTGDVYLQLGNALWLRNVRQEVILSDRIVAGFQLTREIRGMKLATHYNEQLMHLYGLCEQAGVPLPKYEREVVVVAKEEAPVEQQWAHLDRDGVSEVIFSAAISPNEIYFRLCKFNHLLYTLQKEIQESLRKPNYPKLKNVQIGTICLAKDVDGQYARVIVLKTEETDNGGRALCFFVDFGDEIVVDITELKHIHAKFVTKLPFQTIQCRLYGIKPNLNEWQKEAVDVLYEYAMEPNTDIFRSLYVKCCGKESNAFLAKQNRYSVVLKDGFGDKRALINNLLVECGLAVPDTEEVVENFDIPEGGDDREESDEELERILDVCRKTDEIEENFCVSKTAIEKFAPKDDDMELFIINPEEFFLQLINSKRSNPEPSGKRELPIQKALPPVNYCTPDLWWSQTEKTIKIDIKLHDVQDYNLTLIKGRILNFKTILNEKTYIVKLMLYEKVETVQHTAMGPQVRIKLAKSKDIEWPRLILAKQNARNIHYDMSTMKVEEKRRKVLELPGMSDDSETDDDNIDVMYHVCSDMDSDFDLEMAHDSD